MIIFCTCLLFGGAFMNFKLDKERFDTIREVCSKYGLKITSSIILTVFLLGSSAKSEPSSNKSHLEYPNFDAIQFVRFERIVEETLKQRSSIQDNYRSISLEDKIDKILDLYHLTYEELDVCCAIACAEANGEGMIYEEASNVINTAYNRITSAKWVASLGDNLYDQMTAPNQFVVYQNESYLKFLGRNDLPGYQAVIDFLSNTTELEPHKYLSFRSNHSGIDGVELVCGGNLYFNMLTKEDQLDDFRTSSLSLTLKKNY